MRENNQVLEEKTERRSLIRRLRYLCDKESENNEAIEPVIRTKFIVDDINLSESSEMPEQSIDQEENLRYLEDTKSISNLSTEDSMDEENRRVLTRSKTSSSTSIEEVREPSTQRVEAISLIHNKRLITKGETSMRHTDQVTTKRTIDGIEADETTVENPKEKRRKLVKTRNTISTNMDNSVKIGITESAENVERNGGQTCSKNIATSRVQMKELTFSKTGDTEQHTDESTINNENATEGLILMDYTYNLKEEEIDIKEEPMFESGEEITMNESNVMCSIPLSKNTTETTNGQINMDTYERELMKRNDDVLNRLREYNRQLRMINEREKRISMLENYCRSLSSIAEYSKELDRREREAQDKSIRLITECEQIRGRNIYEHKDMEVKDKSTGEHIADVTAIYVVRDKRELSEKRNLTYRIDSLLTTSGSSNLRVSVFNGETVRTLNENDDCGMCARSEVSSLNKITEETVTINESGQSPVTDSNYKKTKRSNRDNINTSTSTSREYVIKKKKSRSVYKSARRDEKQIKRNKSRKATSQMAIQQRRARTAAATAGAIAKSRRVAIVKAAKTILLTKNKTEIAKLRKLARQDNLRVKLTRQATSQITNGET